MATTQGSLYTCVMFSTCCSRLGRPASKSLEVLVVQIGLSPRRRDS